MDEESCNNFKSFLLMVPLHKLVYLQMLNASCSTLNVVDKRLISVTHGITIDCQLNHSLNFFLNSQLPEQDLNGGSMLRHGIPWFKAIALPFQLFASDKILFKLMAKSEKSKWPGNIFFKLIPDNPL